MGASGQGSLEIEQTLGIARDAIERDIARYRVGVFASVVLVTAGLRLSGLSTAWFPTVMFLGALAYAVLTWLFLAYRGNPQWLAGVSLAADLASCVAPFAFASRYASPEVQAGNVTFLAYIAGPAMVLTLLINALRNSVAMALVGSALAVALYVAFVPRINGFHPGQISVGTILFLAGFVGMASAIQSRKNLDRFARLHLLRRFLAPEAVERVMQDDPDTALALGGRLVTVTLLSADLRGFTAMSEGLSPTEVMAQLNAYHGAMIDVIDRHGGAIDKFIGDGTLVVFGLTGTKEAAAQAAVACAREMLEALSPHNAERARAGSPPLAMGLAVHTGPVIAGNLGVPGRRLEFTVIGDTVNTVSRLEGETKTRGSPVLVSSTTAALLPNTSGLRELAPVTLRGKAQSTGVFGLVDSQDSEVPRPPRSS